MPNHGGTQAMVCYSELTRGELGIHDYQSGGIYGNRESKHTPSPFCLRPYPFLTPSTHATSTTSYCQQAGGHYPDRQVTRAYDKATEPFMLSLPQYQTVDWWDKVHKKGAEIPARRDQLHPTPTLMLDTPMMTMPRTVYCRVSNVLTREDAWPRFKTVTEPSFRAYKETSSLPPTEPKRTLQKSFSTGALARTLTSTGRPLVSLTHDRGVGLSLAAMSHKHFRDSAGQSDRVRNKHLIRLSRQYAAAAAHEAADAGT